MCEVSRCKRPTMLTYAAFEEPKKGKRIKDVAVCEYHWQKHSDDDDAFDLRVYFAPKEALC